MKFYNKGKALYEKGDFVKAELEFKNAVQIDPKFADGHYMLGMVSLRKGNIRGAYGAFSKAVELSPATSTRTCSSGGSSSGPGSLTRPWKRPNWF